MMDFKQDYMGAADDMVYRMRMLAGSGDVDTGATIIKDMNQLVQDATGFDRANETDDSTMALSYILDIQETMVGNLPAIPTGNRSRTAIQAAQNRAA